MRLVFFKTNSYTGDLAFKVSDEDYDRVTANEWSMDTNGRKDAFYPVRSATKEEIAQGAPKKIKLHRFILNLHLSKATTKEPVDHLDGNTLNNTRENLQLKTSHGNCRNQRNNTCMGEGLWGVSYDRRSNKWRARYKFNRKNFHVGTFKTELLAHKAAVKAYRKATGKKPVVTVYL